MRKNRLRELLDSGRPSLGTHLSIPWPAITELVGHARAFDYVEFVAEYTPYDLFALENLGRAIDLFDHMTGMMKIEQHSRSYLATRAIGSGIQNLLFADVRTVEDVRECVRAVRAETPGRDGLHGVGMRRDVGYVLEGGSPAFVEALDQAVVADHDREAPGGREPRRDPGGARRRHGPVRPLRLRDEHRDDGGLESPEGSGRGTSRDRGGPGAGDRPPGGDLASARRRPDTSRWAYGTSAWAGT